jgi:dynein heavy chain
LARLSAFIQGFDIDQMVVTSNFNMNDLRAFLQEIYKKIAKPSSTARVFLLTD